MNTAPEIPDLSGEQFKKFARLIHEMAGITLNENKITLLSNRLRKRLRSLGFEDFDRYYTFLASSADSSEEVIHFLEAITTNESYFWRTTSHFELMKTQVLPELLKNFPGRKLSFWSAGCSTGEEPYNMAIELIESMKTLGFFNFSILATDISNRVVDFARAGIYSGRKIEKIPPQILVRYFRQDEQNPDNYVVRDDIKGKVEFRTGNLFEMEVSVQHCIFCRNVMIYFNREDQLRIVNRFSNLLYPGGFLILGHAESLHAMNTPFQYRTFSLGSVYQKPIAGSSGGNGTQK